MVASLPSEKSRSRCLTIRQPAHAGAGVPARLGMHRGLSPYGYDFAEAERVKYDAYGKRTVLDANGLPKSGNGVTTVAFTGRTIDDETGLMYFRARMYSVTLGRFVSRDPIGYVNGYGLYLSYFVPNDLDPSGNVQWSKLFSGIAKIAGGAVTIAGGVVATGGTGGAAVPVGMFLIIGGTFSISSGMVDFAMAFTGGEGEFPSSIPGAAAMVTVKISGTEGTLTGNVITGAGEIADIVGPGGAGYVTRKTVADLLDATEHVQTISEKGVLIYNELNGSGQSGGSTGGGGGIQVGNKIKVTLAGTATLKCKGKFLERQVKSGDTIWGLWTKRFDKSISWADMMSANVFLKDPNKIYPGEYVCAPCIKEN